MDIDVEGYLGEAEYNLLIEMAAKAKFTIVEIGSYRGRSTVALATHAKVPVYAIDPHEPFISEDRTFFAGPDDRKAFMKNILNAGVAEMVRLINLPSAKVAQIWDRPIDLLWIDGDHREIIVRRDVHDWSQFVVPGGYLLLHDINTPGVQAAMHDLSGSRFMRHETEVPIAIYERIHA